MNKFSLPTYFNTSQVLWLGTDFSYCPLFLEQINKASKQLYASYLLAFIVGPTSELSHCWRQDLEAIAAFSRLVNLDDFTT